MSAPGGPVLDDGRSRSPEIGHAVIVGWQCKRNQPGALGALIVGIPAEDGTLRYAGKVEAGLLTAASELLRTLRPLRRKTPAISSFFPATGLQNTIWVSPKLVCELSYDGVVPISGVWRRPRLQGLATSLTLTDLSAATTSGEPAREDAS